MKRLVLSFLASLGILLAIPAVSLAASATTDISGTVTSNGQGVAGAKVVVVCDNNAKKDTTDASGGYLVQFKAADCPDGTKATVVATKGNKGGTSTGTVAPVTTKLNVAIINISLPEFGLVAGIGATLIGGGAFMVVRRRQLSGHEA